MNATILKLYDAVAKMGYQKLKPLLYTSSPNQEGESWNAILDTSTYMDRGLGNLITSKKEIRSNRNVVPTENATNVIACKETNDSVL